MSPLICRLILKGLFFKIACFFSAYIAKIVAREQHLCDHRVELGEQVVIDTDEASLADGSCSLFLDHDLWLGLDAQSPQPHADSPRRDEDHAIPAASQAADVLNNRRNTTVRMAIT